MQITIASTLFYRNLQVTYKKTGDSLEIICTKNYWYCPILVDVIWKCNRGPVLRNTV